MSENTLRHETAASRTYSTSMGDVTIYFKDEPGPTGRKAGTTKMVYKDPPPRRWKLKKKYRG
jgi:hypothetical protein